LTGTLLFVMNVFKKSEGFEDRCLMQMRKQARWELSKSKII